MRKNAQKAYSYNAPIHRGDFVMTRDLGICRVLKVVANTLVLLSDDQGRREYRRVH